MKYFSTTLRALPLLMALFFFLSPVIVVSVYAQGTSKPSISGDEVCGKITGYNSDGSPIINKCQLTDLSKIVKNALTAVIAIGLPLLVVFVTYRFVMAWFSLQQGNANAYKDALSKSTNAILGFFIIVALMGGLFFVVLKYFGIKDSLIGIPLFRASFLDMLATHAYAQERYLPNFFPSNDIYDLLMAALRLVMRFFIYPALIVIWVWTGFSFVAAQGAPAELLKAKKWFMWAVITTVVIFVVQMFLLALQGTVERVLPASSSQTTTTSGSGSVTGGSGVSNPVNTPPNNQAGAACSVAGTAGVLNANGACITSTSPTTNSTAGSYGGANYDSRILGGGDFACSVKNGGTCRQGGVIGTCSDWICIKG